MAIIQTACTCGTKVEIRTGVDSGSSFRKDGKQAVYPFRCRNCRMPLHEKVPEYAFEEPSHDNQ